VTDDEHVDRRLGRYQLQAQLLLEYREQIRRRVAIVIVLFSSAAPSEGRKGRPLHNKVVPGRTESCLILNADSEIMPPWTTLVRRFRTLQRGLSA
jgi:hypothetical protein